MCILYNLPFWRVLFLAKLRLIRIITGTKVYGSTGINGIRQDILNTSGIPGIRILRCFTFPLTTKGIIIRWCRELFTGQRSRNITKCLTFQIQLEDTAYDLRRFLIYDPSMLILQILLITIRWLICNRLTGLGLQLDRCPDLLTDISQIPFI